MNWNAYQDSVDFVHFYSPEDKLRRTIVAKPRSPSRDFSKFILSAYNESHIAFVSRDFLFYFFHAKLEERILYGNIRITMLSRMVMMLFFCLRTMGFHVLCHLILSWGKTKFRGGKRCWIIIGLPVVLSSVLHILHLDRYSVTLSNISFYFFITCNYWYYCVIYRAIML